MKSTETSRAAISDLEAMLPYNFRDKKLARQALTVTSNGDVSYQNLEFLGDRVVNLCIADWAYRHAKESQGNVGDCAMFMSYWGNNQHLATRFLNEGMERLMLKESGENLLPRSMRPLKLYADCLECIFGALALDSDYNLPLIMKIASGLIVPPTTKALEWELQKCSLKVPVTEQPLPDHLDVFGLMRILEDTVKKRVKGFGTFIVGFMRSEDPSGWVEASVGLRLACRVMLKDVTGETPEEHAERALLVGYWSIYQFLIREYPPLSS